MFLLLNVPFETLSGSNVGVGGVSFWYLQIFLLVENNQITLEMMNGGLHKNHHHLSCV